jgi:catechol 2,3-dioxygenase-like lactoylglutathione lyase family enzyme
MTWRAILGFRLVTADLDRSAQFYARLGFTTGVRGPIVPEELAMLGLEGLGTRQAMRLGPSRIDLDLFERPGRSYPAAADAASLLFQHLALVTDDAARAWRRAEGAGAVPISRAGPVTLPASTGGVTAAKFRDPDGHPLELLQFPDGTAHGWPGTGMLGIDHSALSVANVPTSLGFYESHGLTQGKTTLNRGPAQVALDGLDGVEVEVVPLRPAAMPPHLELLGYRHPRGTALGPVAPNDTAATRVVWRAGRAELLRDPDGHLHQLEP